MLNNKHKMLFGVFKTGNNKNKEPKLYEHICKEVLFLSSSWGNLDKKDSFQLL